MIRRHVRLAVPLALFAATSLAPPARATVADTTATGFQVRQEALVHAAPAVVYEAIVRRVGAWWDSDHTYSGDSRNLSIDARPGGCFCEKLAGGGGVMHMMVVDAEPGRRLRLVGALGPMQRWGVAGSMTWTLEPVEGGTKLSVSYSAGGYFPGGLGAFAPAVDEMLGDQFARLKNLIATGKP